MASGPIAKSIKQVERGDIVAAHRLIGEHVEGMRSRVDRTKVKLARLASDVKSLYLDGLWVSRVMASLSVASPENALSTANTTVTSVASMVRGSQLVSSAISNAETALFVGAVAVIDQSQRDEYRLDHDTRCRIYDAVTNPNVKLKAVVTEEELATLAMLPLEGGDRNEWLGKAATDFSDSLRAATVRIVSASRGGAERRGVDLAAAVNRSFDTWLKKVSRIAYLAGLVALHASSKVFMVGLAHPARRADMRRVM